MHKLLFTLVVLIGLGYGTYWYTQKRPVNTPPQTNINTRFMSIVNRQGAAFGMLDSSKKMSAPTAAASSAATALDQKVSIPGAIGMLVYTAPYVYDYTGETFTIPNFPVLKRNPGFSSSQFASLVQGLRVDLIALPALTNTNVQQITLAEGKDKGYTVSIDAVDGSVSMYQSISDSRIVLLKDVAVPATSTATAVTTLPSDAELIAAANAFLTTYGITHDDYGTPTVDKSFFPMGILAPTLAFPVPVAITVTYPLVVQGKSVVSEAGYSVGLSVGIDATTKQVVSVNNLHTLTFEASSYALTEDVQKVLAVAKQGGLYGSIEPAVRASDVKGDTAHVELGTPTAGYMSSYYQLDETNAEYLVPVLIFPITKVPVGMQLYRTAVVVPLVQELLTPPTTTTPPSASGGSGTAPAVDGTTPETQ